MKKAMAVVSLITNIIIFGACFLPCFSQEQLQTVQSRLLKGNIVNLDFVGSKITIKYLQPNGDNDEITLRIALSTKITQNDLRISVSDLSNGDEVAVRYYDDLMSFNAPKASWINVNR